MTFEEIFSKVQQNFVKAQISDFTQQFAFQFNITGDGEGIFYAAYKNDVLSVEPYDYKDRDVIFTADGQTFIDIASGKLEPIDAIKNGKLFVDGSENKAKELMLLIAQKNKASAKTENKPVVSKSEEPAKAETKTAEVEVKEVKTAEPKKEVKTAVKKPIARSKSVKKK